MPTQGPTPGVTRRDFVRASTTLLAVSAVPAIPSVHVAGKERLRVGLVGCGGRGTGAAVQALQADPAVVLTALGDVFSDRLQNSLKSILNAMQELGAEHGDAETWNKKVDVGDERAFVGFDAYQKVLEHCDVVLLATPPHFRPAHLEAAVNAGKHVFCEKPMAVDAPGVRSVLKSVEEARARKLSLVSGFCWRYSLPDREAFSRIHQGAVGDVQAVSTVYNTGPLGTSPRQEGWSDMEWQLRNWQHFTWLSGDHIVEQAVHSIDKLAWAMNDEVPVKATAVGGRQCRSGPESGNVYDHFSVTYEYESGARGFHMCRQIANTPFDNSDTILGQKGICEINSWGPTHVIEGEKPWRGRTPRNDMYQQEHDELFAAIRAGNPRNDGPWMASSTMMAILARMAAYTGQVITWEQALASKERLGPTEYRWGGREVEPVAMPGQTKFL